MWEWRIQPINRIFGISSYGSCFSRSTDFPIRPTSLQILRFCRRTRYDPDRVLPGLSGTATGFSSKPCRFPNRNTFFNGLPAFFDFLFQFQLQLIGNSIKYLLFGASQFGKSTVAIHDVAAELPAVQFT